MHNSVAGTMVHWSQKLTCYVEQVYRLLFRQAFFFVSPRTNGKNSIFKASSNCNVLRRKGCSLAGPLYITSQQICCNWQLDYRRKICPFVLNIIILCGRKNVRASILSLILLVCNECHITLLFLSPLRSYEQVDFVVEGPKSSWKSQNIQ